MQVVADYSSLVSGAVSKTVKGGEVIIPISVVALVEAEMRSNKADGFVAAAELKSLKSMVDAGKLELRFTGQKPRHVSREEADWDAREAARVEGVTLFTSSNIQNRLAGPLGLQVQYLKQADTSEISISRFFDETTMSVHIKEGTKVFAKKGSPGAWKFLEISEKEVTNKEVEELAREIVEKSEQNPMAFIEVDKEGATVVQYENYRIVITRHPFSKGTEITAVRPVKKLTIVDYKPDDSLMKRFEERAEGIVIAGSPGAGKTTMAQALAEFYAQKGKIVKTIEHPRDLNVLQGITQYGHLEGDPEGTGEVLLLVRPDFTVYDELRTTRDFEVYSDMRLAGVGMIGVVHASRAIDAIQRFLGRLEMGVIPQVLDTVIFLQGGDIKKVFELEMVVKVPSGMMEADLARPVVVVRDFFTQAPEFEIYAFGEETSIVPVKEGEFSPLQRLAEKELKRFIQKEVPGASVHVKVEGERSAAVYVSHDEIAHLIGKKGKNIEALEKKLGMSIDVRDIHDLPKSEEVSAGQEVPFDIDEHKNAIYFYFDSVASGRQVSFYIGSEYIFSAVVSKKGRVKVGKKTDVGKRLVQAMDKGENLRTVV